MKSLRSGMGMSGFSRRPCVQRQRTNYYACRLSAVNRYKRGIEAASLFELPDGAFTRAEAQQPKVYTNPVIAFAAHHKKALIAASIVLVIALSATFGVFYVNNLFHSDTVFIQDETQAGSVTITERLTTSSEMSEKVSYFLLVGVDDSSLLTDCIWMTCYDIEASKLTVMQIPRDTYVGDESYTGKINGVYGNPQTVKYCEHCDVYPEDDEISGGIHTVCGEKVTKVKESNISALIRVINDDLGLPVDHFVIFNFAGFAKIVNTMGGVEITLENGIHDGAITLSAGTHNLSGWQAVDYMRHRKSYTNGDISRVSAQRILINALMKKAFSMELSDMLGLVTKCVDCFQTDLSLSDITKYATSARSVSTDNLEMFTMPGYDHWVRPNPSYYVCSEEDTALAINEKLLPYGLPGGGYATSQSVSFPVLVDKLTAEVTTAKPATPTSTTASTTTIDGGDITTTTTTTTVTGGSSNTHETTATTSTLASTTATTTTTTTTPPPVTTTTTTTAQPATAASTSETFATVIDEVIAQGDNVGSSQFTALSNPWLMLAG